MTGSATACPSPLPAEEDAADDDADEDMYPYDAHGDVDEDDDDVTGAATACPSPLPAEEGSDTEQMRSRRGCNIVLSHPHGDDARNDDDGGEDENI